MTIGKFNPDVPIDVFEAGSAITTTGAGVTMWKRTWQVMQRLGMDTDLAKRTVVPPADEPGSYVLSDPSSWDDNVLTGFCCL